MKSISSILMNRDGLTQKQADELVSDAQDDLHNRLSRGEMPDDVCMEWFGLEPDYIDRLI